MSESVQDQIKRYFITHPNPKDEDIHALADTLQIDPHALETEIYSLLSGYISNKDDTIRSTIKNVQADKSFSITINTKDLMDHLIGEVDDFYRNGIFYEHEDGIASIDGRNVIEDTLNSISTSVTVGKSKTKIELNIEDILVQLKKQHDYPSQYTLEDFENEISENPLKIIAYLTTTIGNRANPFDYKIQSSMNWDE